MVNWNKEQKAVIESRKNDKQILVSAAAGSGKTAVLVERILESLLDTVEGEYVNDIDDFLVVTFTRAAAAQMKDKITKQISSLLSEEGGKEFPDIRKLDHLAKQQIAVGRADICTLDSFSAKIVRENFSLINIDPAFTTVDGDMMKLVKDDVIDGMFDELFSGKDGRKVKAEDFALLAEVFFRKTDDKDLKKVFFDIMRVAETMPDPVKWLEDCRIKEEGDREDCFNNLPWVGLIMDDIKGRLESALEVNSKVIRRAEVLMEAAESPDETGSAEKLLEKAVNDREKIMLIISNADRKNGGSYRDFLEALNTVTFEKKGRNDDAEYSELRQKYSLKTGMIFSIMNTILGKGKIRDTDSVISDIYDNAAKWIDIIVDFCLEYYERVMAEKHHRRQYEFSDISHFALRILKENKKAAGQLSLKYRYIYVDEYQDSNYIQEDMLNLIARFKDGTPTNIFMVGDVKQSIYRFRQAKPELFVNKYDAFCNLADIEGSGEGCGDAEDAPGIVIDLSTNYRSRKPVLDATNAVFHDLMKKDLGGIDYNDRVALSYGAGGQGIYDADGDHPVQLTIITNPSEEDGEEGKADESINNDEYEAAVVADKIATILDDETFLVNSGDGGRRRVMPSDIVILMRGIKGRTDAYIDALGRRGIGTKVDNNTGYFDAAETVTMISMLKVIDNCRQDIPLAAVLNSEIGGLNNSEMMIIAGDNRQCRTFYDACESFMEKYGSRSTDNSEEHLRADADGSIKYMGTETAGSVDNREKYADDDTEAGNCEKKKAIAARLERFFDMVDSLSEKQGFITISAIIREIFERTGYDVYVSALPSGERRLANLSMLMKKADDFEKSSFSGLFDFLRYIDKCRIHDIDFAEADVDADGSNKVTIMSIHKSKGLEFPVVFLVGLGHEFNKMDAQGDIFVDGDNHLAVSFMDPKRRVIDKGFMLKAFIRLSVLGRVEEEQRLLYVGMTRARERLFMTGVDKSYFKKKTTALDYKTRSALDTYLTWIEPVVARDKKGLFETEIIKFGDIKDAGRKAGRDVRTDYDRLTAMLEEESFSDAVRDRAERIMEIYDQNRSYAYRDSTVTRAKMSVTGIKKNLNTSEDEVEERYSGEIYDESLLSHDKSNVEEAAGETGSSRVKAKDDDYFAARRGTLLHKVFELMDFKAINSADDMKNEVVRVLDDPYFTDKDRLDITESNDISAVVRFADSELFRKMKAADERGQLYKEAEFTMGIPAKLLTGSGTKPGSNAGDMPDDGGIGSGESSQDISDEFAGRGASEKMSSHGVSGDTVIIQGIIDAYFIDPEGRAVIVDYKTDRTHDRNELIRRHGLQLKLYSEALSGIKGLEVGETYIYSLEIGEVCLPDQ